MLTPANDNHPKYAGPHWPTKESAREAGSRWFFTGKPCANGHLSPRQSSDGKCAVCVWLQWEKVRRRKGKKPFQPNVEKAAAAERGEKFFQGKPCPHGHDGKRWTHNSACVECTINAAREFHRTEEGLAYAQKWRVENLDKVREHNRNTKARRKGAEGSHTAQDIREILKRQKFKCAECGVSVRKQKNRHIDHIMPLARGGTNWAWNLQILCPRCNMSKGAMHPVDWAQSQGRLI